MKLQSFKNRIQISSIDNLAFLKGCRLFLFFIISFAVFSECSIMSFADTIKTTDSIYADAETNGIAVAICKAIDMGTILMIPLFAIMFSIIGLGAYQGKVQWTSFVTFALGIAAFKGAGSIAEIFMPKMGLEYGCKCAVERDIRDQNGIITTLATGLNYDCSSGFTDYNELHS